MLDRAKRQSFAYPAINVDVADPRRRQRGSADVGSDGIVQVSTGAQTTCSASIKNMVMERSPLRRTRTRSRSGYDVNMVLHSTTARRTSSTALFRRCST